VLVSTPTHDRRTTLVMAQPAVLDGARRVVKANVGPKLADRLDGATSSELKAIVAGIDALLAVLDRSAAAPPGRLTVDAPRQRAKRRP
jgi:hypothetical protein